jgi:hypothetical protein
VTDFEMIDGGARPALRRHCVRALRRSQRPRR